ncbi:NAD(+) diphosphatase [Frigidibacter sp. ROC022]|uniref:NAD(+) diphosphatase n=1 Tax=Frigidibacter sp. ROC022 TaxID=2971796 RepID=UPI00215B55CC|nr:NAD(+) diphosphatase [Frigidibacter sp. ROC022]MCR8725958.1 NAD(+) diphosphatase [Frigidibacter sp. ROC022]
MKLAETVTFGGSGLDRAGHLRGDSGAQARLLADPEARVLPIWRGKPLVTGEAELTGGWLRPSHPALLPAPDVPPVFLGLDEGRPRFTVDVSAWNPESLPDSLGAFLDPSEQRHPDLDEDQRFVELRACMTRLSPREAELIATAKAVLGWHQSHGFCSACGVASEMTMAGWQRDCPACGTHHFPRTDPVVIMLITHGNSVLLGRSPNWPEGMYSLLAGFVEPGETLEAAVRREVFEETAVKVGSVGYLASQPWPFPASLMFGCRGEALTREIKVDPSEIEDAMWMTREEVMQALAGESPRMRAPRAGAIAGFLLTMWVADRLE